MYVNGVATAGVNETEYLDGWIRTFRKKEIPKFTDQERELLKEYLEKGEIEEIAIYLDHFRGVTGEVAEFAIRELVRGNL